MAQTQPRLTPTKTEKRLRGLESRSASRMNSTPTCSARVAASVLAAVGPDVDYTAVRDLVFTNAERELGVAAGELHP